MQKSHGSGSFAMINSFLAVMAFGVCNDMLA